MASGSFWQSRVICPMYIRDDGRHCIKCEGIVDKSQIAFIFQQKADFTIQMQLFCCQNYIKCEIYRMLIEKYEEY